MVRISFLPFYYIDNSVTCFLFTANNCWRFKATGYTTGLYHWSQPVIQLDFIIDRIESLMKNHWVTKSFEELSIRAFKIVWQMLNFANSCFIGANHCWRLNAKLNKSQRKSFSIEIEFGWRQSNSFPQYFIPIFDLAHAYGIQIIFSILTV